MRIVPLTALVGVLLLLGGAACSSGDRAGPPGGDTGATVALPDLRSRPGSAFDVALSPNTVALDAAAISRSLRGMSEAGDILVFDGADDRVSRLVPGKVLLIENVALLKVAAVERDDDLIVVGTVPATLPEAITRGTIKWDAPVRFEGTLAGLLEKAAAPGSPFALWRHWPGAVTLHAASGAFEKSGETDGWKYKMTSVPSPDRLDINLYVSKQVGDLQVELHGAGFLKNFETQTTIEIQDNALKYFDHANRNLNGEMQFEWMATLEGKTEGLKGDGAKFKWPTSFSMPLPIGGIPFVLEVTAALLFEPVFGEKREMGRGSFGVSYNGVTGFNVANGSASSTATFGGKGTIGEVASVSMVPSGVIIGLAAPKIELKLGPANGLEWLKKVVPKSSPLTAAKAVHSSTIIGKINNAIAGLGTTLRQNEAAAQVSVTTMYVLVSSGPFSLIPCQKSTLTVFGKAGAGVKIMGVSVGEKSIDVFRQEFKKVVPDRKACDI